jgi:hypothetical protein
LASDRHAVHFRRIHRPDRPQDLQLLVADGGRLEGDGRLHGHHCHELEKVVLDHVPEGSGLLVETAPGPDSGLFGDGYLHVHHVLAVPERLEDAVGEAQSQDVLDGLLPEVVVDAVDLVLVEDGGDERVELVRGILVTAERLLEDRPGPSRFARPAAPPGQPGGPEVSDYQGGDAGGDGEVEEEVVADRGLGVDALQDGRERGVRGGVGVVAAHGDEPPAEPPPGHLAGRSAIPLAPGGLQAARPEPLVAVLATGEAHYLRRGMKEALPVEAEKRRDELPERQVPGGTEDDDGAGAGVRGGRHSPILAGNLRTVVDWGPCS